MVDFRNLRTLRQVADAPGSPFTEPSLRWLVFHAETNGLDSAIVRVGRRIYFDLERFNRWLEKGREAGAETALGQLSEPEAR